MKDREILNSSGASICSRERGEDDLAQETCFTVTLWSCVLSRAVEEEMAEAQGRLGPPKTFWGKPAPPKKYASSSCVGWKNSNENNSAHSEQSTLQECSHREFDSQGHLGEAGRAKNLTKQESEGPPWWRSG